MSVHVTQRHMYVQFIDDVTSRTLAAMSTQSSEMRSHAQTLTVETAQQLGRLSAEAARGQGIETVVFDRGGFRYGGRIRALADAAREAGLKF